MSDRSREMPDPTPGPRQPRAENRRVPQLGGPVLCAVEHPVSGAALHLALAIADAHGAQVAVLGIVRPLPFPARLFLDVSRHAIERDRERAFLKELTVKLPTVPDAEPTRYGVYTAVGSWVDGVARHARTFGGELLVVPAAALGGPDRRQAHDRARRLVGHTSQSVLSVAADATMMPRCALVAVDFGAATPTLAKMAMAVLDPRDATLLLTHVTPAESADWSEEWRRSYAESAQRHMRALLEGIAVPGAVRARSLVVEGEPAEQLLAVAADEQCDLVVFGSRGGGGGSSTDEPVGRIADALLRAEHHSLLVVPVSPATVGDEPGTTPPEPRAGSRVDPRIERVLVPLDGAPKSERVLLPAALAVARRTGARMSIVHVRSTKPEVDAASEAHPAALLPEAIREAGLEVDVTVLYGSVPDTLLEHATATRTDLIVMTSYGRGGLERALLGSVADAVIRHARIPVLLVRTAEHRQDDAAEAVAGEPSAGTHFRRVLLPLDGSATAERIVPYALALTGVDGVRYDLLRVQPPPLTDSRPSAGRLLGRTPASERDFYLAGMAGRLAERGVLVSTRAPTHASPADTIVQIAADNQVQLIAMTTRGLGGADRLLFGSVADAVLRHAPCPVLVLRPAPEDEPGLHAGADVRPSPAAG